MSAASEHQTMAAEHYSIDAGMSRFTVKAFASGLLSALGHNPTLAIRDFSGEAKFIPDTLDEAFLQIRIKSRSLEVTDDISDKDRREIERATYEEVLETDKHPEILFESSNITANRAGDRQYFVNLVGNLTFHGVTRSQPVSTQVSLTGANLRAYGQFSLLQSSYGIKPVSVAGGSLKLKDELKFTFDIVARKTAA